MKKVSKTGKNYGRKFHCCPRSAPERCNFFVWVPDGWGCCASDNTRRMSGIPDMTHPTSDGAAGNESGIDVAQSAMPSRGNKSSPGKAYHKGSVPSGQSRRNGKGRKRKKCELGNACPFQHEHQHTEEYSHPSDEPPPQPMQPFSGRGFSLQVSRGPEDRSHGLRAKRGQPVDSGSSGHTLAGVGRGGLVGRGRSSDEPLRRSSSRGPQAHREPAPIEAIDLVSDDSVSDMGGESEIPTRRVGLQRTSGLDSSSSLPSQSDEIICCEICTRFVPITALATHELQHERSGEAAAHRAALERARERKELQEAYEASLRADQEREAREAADREAAERAEADKQAAERQAIVQRDVVEHSMRMKAERQEARREAAEAELRPEPMVGASTTVTLRLVLPSGTSIVRRFKRDAPISQVFLWAESLEEVARLPDNNRGDGEFAKDEVWELVPPIGLDIEGGLLPSEETLEELRLAPDATIRLRPL